jgi:hypothetical protein
MIVRSEKSRTADQTTFIDQLCKSDVTAATASHLAQAFGSLLRNREGKSGLEQWKAAVRASGIPELIDFVEGLADDAEAVINGCTEPWSNGTHGLRNEIHNKQAIEHKWAPQAVSSCFIRVFAAAWAWLQATEMTTCQSQAQSQFTGKSISLRNPWEDPHSARKGP